MAKEKEQKTERQLLVEQLLDQIDFHGLSQEDIFGQDGIIKDLTKRVVERALNAEMDHHLGYEKHSKAGDNTGDSRNGTSKKTIIADNREIEIDVPRDRNGSFEPIAVQKHQKRTPLFNDQIISLYSRGLSTRDIKAHLEDIHGVEVSPELISRVTDAVEREVTEWRNRPLQAIYPVVYLDALRVNSRQDGKNINKSLYLSLGINLEGRREILGMWLAETEGARFRVGVLTELRNRGLEDIFIACMDGLTGFPDAVRTVYPNTHIQPCIVHMVRNSVKYVTTKEREKVCKDLRKVYTAPTEDAALARLDEFDAAWGEKYPMIKQKWLSRWGELSEFFNYPPEIRKLIYTTNAIESLNSRLRKGACNVFCVNGTAYI
jgi:putative transposase